MQCPVCNVNLLMTDRNGIEIDYCPQCRGIWLDRGELDKIIERNQSPSHNQSHSQSPGHHQPHSQAHGYKDHKPHGYKEYEYKKHKKESFLGDLFDF
ncbi:MAG: zf-TFIIB domain-containing protein [Saprospiraceae bacterium]|jgi:Zn-finger nucleic acid-binding protein|nr:zf-TFIIB domain-containing protein [Saprospiraceae bacterium]